jgi:hypothetical protein
LIVVTRVTHLAKVFGKPHDGAARSKKEGGR